MNGISDRVLEIAARRLAAFELGLVSDVDGERLTAERWEPYTEAARALLDARASRQHAALFRLVVLTSRDMRAAKKNLDARRTSAGRVLSQLLAAYRDAEKRWLDAVDALEAAT